jgi:hypothetical protein
MIGSEGVYCNRRFGFSKAREWIFFGNSDKKGRRG